MFSLSAETDSEEASQVALVESVAPSCAIFSAMRRGAAGGSSLVEHVRHQIGQAGLVRRIRAVAGAHDHLDPDQRQLVRLGQDHAQAILQAKPLHLRHLEGGLLAGGGKLMTKLGVRGLARRRSSTTGAAVTGSVIAVRRLHQAAHDGRAAVGLDVDGHARLVAQDLGGPFLQGLRRGRLISAEVAVEVRRIAREHVVS